MRFLILGAGAIGGYFGARLQQAGNDVTFLVRPARQKLLAEQGLKITSPVGAFQGPVKTLTAAGPFGSYDVVILTCKAYDLGSAIEDIRGAVSSSTAILPLLNGISHMDVLNLEFGKERVLGGVARIQVGLTAGGGILHVGDWRSIIVGEQSGEITERVTALYAAFPAESVSAEAVPDIMLKLWEKVVQLGTGAGAASLLRGRVDEIVATPGGSDFLLALLDLNAQVAEAEGFPPSVEYMANFRNVFSTMKDVYEPSMLRDIERHNPTEGQHIVGFMLARARAHGIGAKLLEIVDLHLRVYERRRETGRL